MNADRETLRKIAHLARLDLEEGAEQEMLYSLNKILTWVEKLNEVDTSGVEPLTHLTDEVNVLREDKVQEPLPHERGLFNAPRKDDDYFRVPKVLE
jgi:aspartyl-tRNA(Asn)/glutamyl-tRNA(Gln) amidotransferase subunit C